MIVDVCVYLMMGVFMMKDVFGVCRAWRRDARGEVEIVDETMDVDAVEVIECV